MSKGNFGPFKCEFEGCGRRFITKKIRDKHQEHCEYGKNDV